MFSAGDKVRARHAGFEGTVLGEHGRVGQGAGFTYRSTPGNMNVAVVMVWNESSGEIRYFTLDALERVPD